MFLLLLVGCGGGEARQGRARLSILAAASLRDAFTEIEAAFERTHPDLDVVYSFGGSQQLALQLSQGAPGDVYASANMEQMQVLEREGRVDSATVRVFATNRLVLALAPGNPGHITRPQDLARPGVRIILAHGTVPAGRYSRAFLDRAASTSGFSPGYAKGVLANVISYEQDVRTVLTKVSLGEADAGIVYWSDLARPDARRIGRIEIPDTLNPSASYPVAVLRDASRPEDARRFVGFLVSTEAHRILVRHGFSLP